MTYILGISAFYHDSAAALVHNGHIVAAAQEERFTRIKHDAGFPENAIKWTLEHAGISLNDVDHVAFFEKPFLKFERLLETYIATAPFGFRSFSKAMPIWLKEKLFQKRLITNKLNALSSEVFDPARLLFSEHHLSHAASAFYPSPFEDAVILTMDGVGEWATTTVSIGQGSNVETVREIHFPHSLGLLYSAFTSYTGFRVNSGEYKLMGLAPYGEPKYTDIILENLIDLKPDGSFRVNQKYFDYCAGSRMINQKFAQLFGQPIRRPDEDVLTPFHMDIAASIQSVLEDIILRIVRNLSETYPQKNLCLAGGVALNCVANGKILRNGGFENVWVQPAAGDAGGAVGAALAAWHLEHGHPREPVSSDAMSGAYLGPEYSQSQIEDTLTRLGAKFHTYSEDEMIGHTAQALSEGQAVGWFQGRMEFGPRALGNRSIIANPKLASTQKLLNLKVKFRESFRPFAPSVLEEHVSDWFKMREKSPYMLFVAGVKSEHLVEVEPDVVKQINTVRSTIPAVTHVDNSARVQTVSKDTNPLYHKLISAFQGLTDCPVLVNSSFNVRGEPIVCTPEDAFQCFMGTNLDWLVCGRSIMKKSEQNPALKQDYTHKFALD